MIESSEKKHGRKMTLVELLSQREIVIPIIQRDYAQGRKDIKKSNDIETIRESFLEAIFNSIIDNKPIVLDFIYGSEDSVERFQPIDGQQRLTTLFLIYWYFSVKDKMINNDKKVLMKFTYETRQSSTDFCRSLLKNLVEIPNNPKYNSISDAIKDCPWFHNTWEYDPTISSMLNMLDAIHRKFCIVQNGFELITRKENPLISFWVLSLDEFGLSDDLFIKMNARGKRLSKFENFKASFEDNLDNVKVNDDLADRWKSYIDNEWLDYFWKKYSKVEAKKNNVEIYMYKYILLISEIIYYKRTKKSELQLDFSIDSGYFNIIKNVFIDEDSIQYLCDAMDYLINIEESKCNYDLDDVNKLLNDYLEIDNYNLVFSAKSNIFTCIHFCIIFGYKEDSLFKDYRCLAKKLIRGQRTLRPDYKKYFSTLDASTIGAFLLGIEQILNKLKIKKNVIDTLVEIDTKNITGISYLKHEIEKAVIINNNKPNFRDIQQEVEYFEDNNYFKGMIHNVIDHENKVILLAYSDFQELMEQGHELILRAITSFNFILEDRYSGVWNQFWIKKDENEANAYYQAPYYKQFIGFSPDIDNEDFGDILLTRDDEKISLAVQSFLKKYGELKSLTKQKSAEDIIIEIIRLNLSKAVSPYSEQYYFVKYHEFINKRYNVYGRKNLYAIRKCLYDSYEKGHYNPYQRAVCRIVTADATIDVKASYASINDRDAEELDPIKLNNGIEMYLTDSGNWRILNIENITLSNDVANMIQNDILVVNGKDCIEVAVEFIKRL